MSSWYHHYQHHQVIDEIVDAEVCEVAKAAREVLLKALGKLLNYACMDG